MTRKRSQARRVEPEHASGLPRWLRGLGYDASDNAIELRTSVYIAGVDVQCGPAGTPSARGERQVAVRFTMSPAEARALHKALGRCVDASSAVVLEVPS